MTDMLERSHAAWAREILDASIAATGFGPSP